jgi:hypothetical protein
MSPLLLSCMSSDTLASALAHRWHAAQLRAHEQLRERRPRRHVRLIRISMCVVERASSRLGLTSSESYATAVRGTCYGFSAAVGKTGAVVGTQAFTPIRDNLGPRWTFVRYVTVHSNALLSTVADLRRRTQIIAAICGLTGMLVTVFFIRNE